MKRPMNVNRPQEYIEEAFYDPDEDTELCRKVTDSVTERFQLCVNAQGGNLDRSQESNEIVIF